MDNNPFFSNDTAFNIPKNEAQPYDIGTPEAKRWAIILYVEKNPKSSAYGISKKTQINYAQVYQILRELVFSRVLIVEQGLDIQNRPIEVFSKPKEVTKK